MNNPKNKIVIAGAGVSGIRAAFDLAETGSYVLLVDRAPAHGGILPQLDHQFPDNHCGMCRMLPMVDRDMGKQFCLKKGLIHENIDIMRSCEIKDVTGTPGSLEVTLKQKATGIDPDLCINCGKCEEVCPVTVTDQFNDHLAERKAVYFPVPFQIPNNRTIDPEACTRCGECKAVCEPNAVNLDFEDKEVCIKDVQSVLLSFGNPLYDPSETDLYGFGRLKDVVTSTGFERLISQSGPTKGEALRPSNRKPIKKIAWIQCVGSRNIMTGSDYCSSACCMFSLKESMLAKEKIGPDVDATIFYMDMRTHGRDFQRYRDKAENEYSVRFVRCRVHSIEQDPESFDPKLTYMDESGSQSEECFDLIVLATGKRPSEALPEFTRLKGVHIINSDNEFKDISETVIDASAAASAAGWFDLPAAGSRKNVSGAAPRFLVAVCECAASAKIIGTDQLLDDINQLPGNMQAVKIDSACTGQGFNELIAQASGPEFNRLILLSCSADLFRSKLGKLEEKTGISRYHMDFIEPGITPGDNLLPGIIASHAALKTRNTWIEKQKQVHKHCIIAGSGPAGVAAADRLLSSGIPVTIVEKKEAPGGNLENITGEEEKTQVKACLDRVKAHENFMLLTKSEIRTCTGTPGSFSLSIESPGGFSMIPAGAVILATGGGKKTTQSYGYDGKKVLTLYEFENTLETTDLDGKKIVMIQCIDSREEPDNYCSRICCIKALKTALKIKDKSPGADITILYRDIMTYGEHEKIYTRARRKGIRFIPFSKDKKPGVRDSGETSTVKIFDPILQEDILIEADIVSLSTGLTPFSNLDLETVFGLEKTQDGFIKEADYKWRPVDTGREGIFVAGLARRPLNALEAMKEGRAAAMRAIRILSHDRMATQMVTAMVRHTICSRCELCIPACPYQARFIESGSGRVMVDDASCQACGTCASACPNNAVVISGFEDGGVMSRIESLI